MMTENNQFSKILQIYTEIKTKYEKEANLQLNVLEELRDELKEILNLIKEGYRMRWSKKTENTVQDFDGEEYNIDEIVAALNYYQKKVDSLTKENEELKKNCRNYEWYKEYKKLLNENEQLNHDKILYEVEKIIDNKIEFLQKDIKELRKCINPYPVKEAGINRG